MCLFYNIQTSQPQGKTDQLKFPHGLRATLHEGQAVGLPSKTASDPLETNSWSSDTQMISLCGISIRNPCLCKPSTAIQSP